MSGVFFAPSAAVQRQGLCLVEPCATLAASQAALPSLEDGHSGRAFLEEHSYLLLSLLIICLVPWVSAPLNSTATSTAMASARMAHMTQAARIMD
eukprot:CAMPEP_0181496284 /NCGR_PEP_ID=MMETSP1110-20121109/52885_1 /TAXON_ID=174948 /ORGANISM="Symbiodinium sp., Strain CCMP421" /LENGTH=94 /DNA_ID=CAMNT_0023624077 /DNA_START=144 /DNA_END=428 /DNA_ORIENTATION=-